MWLEGLRWERGDRLAWEGRGATHHATVTRLTRSALYLRADDGAGLFMTPGPLYLILAGELDTEDKAYPVENLRRA